MELAAYKNYLFWQLKRGQRYVTIVAPPKSERTAKAVVAHVHPKPESAAESDLLARIWAALDVPNKRWQDLESCNELQTGDIAVVFARVDETDAIKKRYAAQFGHVDVDLEILPHPLDMLARPTLKVPAWSALKAIIQKFKDL